MGVPNPVSSRVRILASATTIAVTAALLAFASPALADTAPPVTTDPTTVSSDALPTPQINGVVWSQVIVGNTDYVAGNFTSARPYGSAAGTNETPRSYLLAYDVTTGVLLSWAPTVNGQVRQLSVSPDKTRLYAVGDFTTVNGVTRNRVAAFDLPSNTLDTAFHPSSNNSVYAVTSTNSTVYLGGTFSTMAGASRVGTAAVTASAGTATAWNPILGNGRAYAMVVSPDGAKVVIGGAFTTMDGSANPGYGLGMVDSTVGNLLPFGTNTVVRDGGVNSAIFSLTSDGDSVYGTGYVFGDGGNLEGTFRSDWNGNMNWVEDCHGDEYSVAVMANTVYIAGHPHYCGNIGGFPQTTPDWTFHRALAFSKAATGTITADPNGYYNFAGNVSPTQLNWFPDINAGTFTGQGQGPWSVAASASYVVYGGEFTQVNSKAQQGLVRFAVPSIAPNLDGPRLTGDNLKPTVQSDGSGSLTVSWPADWDRDNESLTYQVYRDGKTATAAYTTTVSSRFWDRPTISWIDNGLAAGSTHTYRVRATDAYGNTAWGTTVSATVAATGTMSAYAKGVIADQPTNFWRLDDSTTATSANDSVGRSTGIDGTGVTYGQDGPIIGDASTAASFDGTSNGLVGSTNQVWGDQTFTIETWVKTTTSTGGKIVGFGDKNTGTSGNYDRSIYMNASGTLSFGVYNGGTQVVQSSKKYNDGQWHLVTATLGTNGEQLYVDGKRVAYNAASTFAQPYWGYWRIGGDSTWSGDPFIKGTIADTAIYPTALSTTQIQNHYTLSGRTVSQPVAPTDAYGAAVFAADPLLYYRLDETSGTTAADSGDQGTPGIYDGDITLGTTGAVKGTADTAATFSNGGVASGISFDNPTTYSTQIWFKTSTTSGGKLTGFGSSQTGNSNSYDRHVYMQNDGTLVFGTYTGQSNVITSSKSYNDNAWHQVTATQSTDGMKLYVDGVLVGTNPQTGAQAYTGYWRAGNDVTWGSANNNFNGSLDEFAVYQSALSASTIAAQYAIGAPVVANVLPTAAFTSTVTGSSVALDASTSTDSDGTVASYAWDFGDGSTQVASSTATASHSYTTAGTYTVTLTVIDNSGGSDTISHDVTIAAFNTPPTAVFTQTATNLDVAFDATASTDADGSIASYDWSFGDGGVGTGSTAAHSYAAAGNYSVTLTTTDDKGAQTSVVHPITVSAANVAPTAAFTNTATGLVAAFNGSTSVDPDGSISSYDWNFGDGSTDATTVSPSHTFPASGTYTVSLIVTDNSGASTSVSHTVTVANVAPTASFTKSVTNLTLSVNASASTDDGAITGYAWNFGDGITGTGVNAVHTYTAAGTYTVTLTVTDNNGATGSSTASVVATAAPSIATIAEDHFDRTATSSWASATTGGVWTVSSAANSNVASGVGVLTHTAGATRTALLKSVSVTDANIVTDLSFDKTMTGGGAYAGIVARQTTSDYYQARVRFLVGGTLAVQILQGGSTVLANATVAGTYTPGASLSLRTMISGTTPTTISARVWPTGTTEPTTWQVTTTSSVAGLQTAGSIGLVSYASGSITNAPYLAKYDNYVATTGSGTIVTPPANVAPTAAFTATSTNLTTTVDASASTDSDGTIASYAWNFGDGSSATGKTQSHTYTNAGPYTVTLTVTDNSGATATATAAVTATAPVTTPTDPTALASDNFERTTTTGWGTATQGGAWTSTVNSNFVVNNGTGAFVHGAGATRRALLNSVSVRDVELQVQVSSDKAVSTGQIVAGLVARQVGSDFYQGRVRLLPAGAVSLQLVHGSSTVLLEKSITGLTYHAGDQLNLKVRVSGTSPTTIQAKVWAVGTTEPTTWQASATDSTAALQVAGPVGLESYISSSATNAPVTVRYDNFSAVVPQ